MGDGNTQYLRVSEEFSQISDAPGLVGVGSLGSLLSEVAKIERLNFQNLNG